MILRPRLRRAAPIRGLPMIRNVMATFKLLVLSTLLLSLISISACRPRQESLRSDPVYAAIPKDGPLCFLLSLIHI